jgi:hypothetical protein
MRKRRRPLRRAILAIALLIIGLAGIPDDVNTWLKWIDGGLKMLNHDIARWIFVISGFMFAIAFLVPAGHWRRQWRNARFGECLYCAPLAAPSTDEHQSYSCSIGNQKLRFLELRGRLTHADLLTPWSPRYAAIQLAVVFGDSVNHAITRTVHVVPVERRPRQLTLQDDYWAVEAIRYADPDGNDVLTIDIPRLIKAVQQGYPQLQWREFASVRIDGATIAVASVRAYTGEAWPKAVVKFVRQITSTD